MKKIPHNPNEVIAVVNEKDEVIGKAKRKEVHEKGLTHREVFILLVNSNKSVLLSKRTDNNMWDYSSSGHLPYRQDYGETAMREFEEELGIKLEKMNLKKLEKKEYQ